MELWHWIVIGVVVFLLLVWLTKGRIFRILDDVFDILD